MLDYEFERKIKELKELYYANKVDSTELDVFALTRLFKEARYLGTINNQEELKSKKDLLSGDAFKVLENGKLYFYYQTLPYGECDKVFWVIYDITEDGLTQFADIFSYEELKKEAPVKDSFWKSIIKKFS